MSPLQSLFNEAEQAYVLQSSRTRASALCFTCVLVNLCRIQHRYLGLYWVGSIMNSMVVLLFGGLTGKLMPDAKVLPGDLGLVPGV